MIQQLLTFNRSQSFAPSDGRGQGFVRLPLALRKMGLTGALLMISLMVFAETAGSPISRGEHLQQSDLVVSGRVTSQDSGEPLPGVNILVKGTTTGTVTDIDGKYSIGVGSDAVLVFSFIGYESQEIPVGGRSTIDGS